MAFGGVPANTPIYPATGVKIVINAGGTLAAYAGDPTDITLGHVGQFTTGAPAANQAQLTAVFGPGAGNWIAADLNFVRVDLIGNDSAVQQGGMGQISKVRIIRVLVGGNLVVTLANLGNTATGALTVGFHFLA